MPFIRNWKIIYQESYDMFISSGAMKQFSNKELLLEITNCYAKMEETKESHTTYENLKLAQMTKIYDYDTNLLMKDFDITKPMFRGIYNFHLMATNFDSNAKEAKEQIEKVLSNRKKIK